MDQLKRTDNSSREHFGYNYKPCWFCEKSGINPPRPAITGIPRSDGNGFIPWCGEQDCLTNVSSFSHAKNMNTQQTVYGRGHSNMAAAVTTTEVTPLRTVAPTKNRLTSLLLKEENKKNTNENENTNKTAHKKESETSSIFSVFKTLNTLYTESLAETKEDNDLSPSQASTAMENKKGRKRRKNSNMNLCQFYKGDFVGGWVNEILYHFDFFYNNSVAVGTPILRSQDLDQAYEFLSNLTKSHVQVVSASEELTEVVIFSDENQQNPLFSVKIIKEQKRFPKDFNILNIKKSNPKKPLYSVVFTVYINNPEHDKVKMLLKPLQRHIAATPTPLHHAGFMLALALAPKDHTLRNFFSNKQKAFNHTAAAKEANFMGLDRMFNLLLISIEGHINFGTPIFIEKDIKNCTDEDIYKYISYYHAIRHLLSVEKRIDMTRAPKGRRKKSIEAPFLNFYIGIKDN